MTWTLHLEVIFYVALPLIAFGLVRLPWWGKIAILTGIELWSLYAQWTITSYLGRLAIWYIPSAFAPGMIAAVLAERWPVGVTKTALLPIGVAVVFAGLFVAGDSRMDWVTALGAAALIIFLVEGFPHAAPWAAWGITTAAGASYSFYLWHQEVIKYLVAHGAGAQLLVVVAFITTAVIALAIYHVIELPSMRLGRNVALRMRGWHPWVKTPDGRSVESLT